jgi:hypothetical protein
MSSRTRLATASIAAVTAAVVLAALVVTGVVGGPSFCAADPFDRRCANPVASPSPVATQTTTPIPPTPTETAGPIGADRLVWADEFDGTSVDTSKWNVRDDAYASNEASCQLASQVSEADGKLSIRVDKGSYTCGSRVSPYASGYVDSIGKSPAMGVGSRFEWLARMPITRRASQGYWPALWLRSNQPDSTDPAGEIDAVEVWGAYRPDIVDSDHASVHTVHENTEGVAGRSGSIHRWGTKTPGDGFHVYAVDLLPDRIRFSVDRQVVHSVSAATDPWVSALLAPGVTWNVRMNVQICNPRPWCAAPNRKTRFGQSMSVDYVRIYRLPSPPPAAAVPPEPNVVPTPAAASSPSTGVPPSQPWTLSLEATSCALWLGEMFPAQRLAAAAQMLGAARSADGRPGQPPEGLIAAFEADVTTQCGADGDLPVQKAGEAVYAGSGHGRYSG